MQFPIYLICICFIRTLKNPSETYVEEWTINSSSNFFLLNFK